MEKGMDVKGTETEKNLETAFAGESQARNAYIYYAEAAKKAGQPHIADVLLEIAQNEEEHARAHFDFLGGIGDIPANLEAVTEREEYEHTSMYPEFAKTARAEGFQQIADCFERMSEVEGKHEEISRNLLKIFGDRSIPQERTIGHSSVTMAQLMLPHQANPAGYVHGGEIMKIMDNAAGVVAARHAHSNVVTARVDDINFLNPVRVGDLVHVHARLTFVGHSSMEIRIEVETEHLGSEERRQALSAHFIYVALNQRGKPTRVPPLLITTEEGERLFEEGRERYEARRKRSD